MDIRKQLIRAFKKSASLWLVSSKSASLWLVGSMFFVAGIVLIFGSFWLVDYRTLRLTFLVLGIIYVGLGAAAVTEVVLKKRNC